MTTQFPPSPPTIRPQRHPPYPPRPRHPRLAPEFSCGAKYFVGKWAAAVFILLGWALFPVACQVPPAGPNPLAGTSATPGATYALTHWMGSLNGDLRLTRLSIPGSHDAGARYEPVSGTARCQSLTIDGQLNAGVRFLDIRCRHVHDAFAIHHGAVYQNLDFKDVSNACVRFLDQNPTECVILSVKEEYDAADNTRTFEQTFEAYAALNAGRWYLGAGIPTLSAARGKMVLLRRFSARTAPQGIDATKWADNATFSIDNGSALLRIQDDYVVPDHDAKWAAATALFGEAQSGGADVLYLNFTSGYKPLAFSIPSIPSVSNAMNAQVESYFTIHTSGRFGIIVSDFADATKSSLIIRTNF